MTVPAQLPSPLGVVKQTSALEAAQAMGRGSAVWYLNENALHQIVQGSGIFDKYLNITLGHPPSSLLGSALFIVMGSATNLPRAAAIQRAWLKWVPHYVVTMAARNCAFPIYCPNASRVRRYLLPNASERIKANVVQLAAIAELCAAPVVHRRHSWVMVVDDDTFVDVFELQRYIAALRVPPTLPVLIGRLVVDPHGRKLAWPAGGAGILMTMAACRQYARILLTPECPFFCVQRPCARGMLP